MSEHLKKHQPSMTIDEQIENLKEKGLVIRRDPRNGRIPYDLPQIGKRDA